MADVQGVGGQINGMRSKEGFYFPLYKCVRVCVCVCVCVCVYVCVMYIYKRYVLYF